MKRLIGRFSVLSVLAVLGLIAIAQAQREGAPASESPSDAESPATEDGAWPDYDVAMPQRLAEAESTTSTSWAETPVARFGGADADLASSDVPAHSDAILANFDDAAVDDPFAAVGRKTDPHEAPIASEPPAESDSFVDELENVGFGDEPYPFSDEPDALDDSLDASPVEPYDEESPDDSLSLVIADSVDADPSFDNANAFPAAEPSAQGADELQALLDQQHPADAREQSRFSDNDYAPNALGAAAYSSDPLPTSSARSGYGLAAEELGPMELEGPRSTGLAITKLGPPESTLGAETTFRLVIRNTGSTTAEAVEVRDRTPRGARFVSSNPSAQQDADGGLLWRFDRIAAGEQREIELVVIPQVVGEIGSVAEVVGVFRAAGRTRVTQPQLELAVAGPEKVHRGGTVTLHIDLRNVGTGAAHHVVLEEVLPPQLAHDAGRELEMVIDRLAPGETKSIDLVLSAVEAGRAANTLTVRADGDLFEQATTELEVVAPQLAANIVGPRLRYLETTAKYTVKVDNPGTAPAEDVEIAAFLPRGMEFVDANNAGRYDATRHAVYWSLIELPPNTSGDAQLTLKPIGAGEQNVRVEATAAEGLQSGGELTVAVEGITALTFTVTGRNNPVEVGGEAEYEVRVYNTGSKAATNVQLVALAPPGLKILGGKGPTAGKPEGAQMAFAPLPKLAPRTDAVFLVRTKAVVPGAHAMRFELVSNEVQRTAKEEPTQVYSAE